MKTERHPLSALLPAFAAAALIAGHDAGAQNYPNRPVRMIVPYPAGGGTDIISRTVAQKLGEKWGQQVIVDNRGGANGIIGTDLAAKSKPDGYTLVVVIATQAINPALHPKLPYNTEADFAPVTLMAQYPFILTTHPSVPAKTVREFIALAKKRPGEMSYASSGNGSGPHLGFELFKSAAGINIVHVPYKGAGPANTELISGQVQAFFNNILAARPHLQSNRLRVLAATSARRSQAMPELPTLAESGLPGFDVTGWYALLAPAGTPAAIIGKVQADAAAALQIPEVASRLSSEGAEPVGSAPEQLAKFLQAETRKWAQVVKTANIRLD
ncbi:MAG: tripartite tricarboxylate transporter substrate binding protein [Burkholderiales bacterium]|nr:tripartite tricarboxylate transporter substrate binding protein [Burkholderiales bacterium]